MIRISRGDEPTDLADARMTGLPPLRSKIAAGGKPERVDIVGYGVARGQLWKDQHGKCAYCEGPVISRNTTPLTTSDLRSVWIGATAHENVAIGGWRGRGRISFSRVIRATPHTSETSFRSKPGAKRSCRRLNLPAMRHQSLLTHQ